MKPLKITAVGMCALWMVREVVEKIYGKSATIESLDAIGLETKYDGDMDVGIHVNIWIRHYMTSEKIHLDCRVRKQIPGTWAPILVVAYARGAITAVFHFLHDESTGATYIRSEIEMKCNDLMRLHESKPAA